MKYYNEIKFLPLEPHHLNAVAEVEAVCFNGGWSMLTLRAVLDDLGSHFVVAELEGKIVGYGGVRKILDEANLDNIAVLPNCQKMGIGKAMLKHLVSTAKALECSVLMLEVRETNSSAISLYQSFGFVEVGKRVGYYTKPEEAAVLMNLEL